MTKDFEIKIPRQLWQKNFRFIKIDMEGPFARKKPLEMEWQTKNNYYFNHTDLLDYISKDNNYGFGIPAPELMAHFFTAPSVAIGIEQIIEPVIALSMIGMISSVMKETF